jgi:photosystem II stability/assembly factor-like uncharacterized protein
MKDHLDSDELIGELLRRELPIPEHREGYRERVAARIAAEAPAVTRMTRKRWMPELRWPLAARVEERSGVLKRPSAPRRRSGLRVAIYASIAVVLVAAVAIGSLEVFRHLGKDQPILVIGDDTLSPTATGESNQTTATGGQGEQWERLPLTSEGGAVSILVMDPSNPSVLYAARSDGLFKSSDAAGSWERLAPLESDLFPVTDVTLIAVDPASPSTVYVTTWAGGPGLFRSDDGGASWVDFSLTWNDVIPAMAETMDLSPGSTHWMWFDTTSAPSTMYLAGASQTGPGTAVCRSTDRGESWTRLGPEEAAQALAKQPEGAFRTDFRGAVRTDFRGTVTDADTGAMLAVSMGRIDPDDPSIRYAGTEEGVCKSTDGGSTWRKANAGLVTSVAWRVVPDPSSPSILCAATPEGIFKSGDGGITWSMILPGQGSVVLAPSSPSTLYAWTSAGLFRTDDGGAEWTQLTGAGLVEQTAPSGAEGGLALVAADDPDTVFAMTGMTDTPMSRLFRSTDGGNTWSQAHEGMVSGTSGGLLAADPMNLSTLFAATVSGEAGQVLKSTDAGDTWTVVAPAAEWTNGLQDIAVDSHTPSNVYVIQSQGLGSGPNPVFRSPDGGATWEKVDLANLEGLGEPFWSPQRVLFDPRSPDTLYVPVVRAVGWGIGAGLYRSSDGGVTWENIIGEFSGDEAYSVALNVVIDPAPGGGLYAATEAGLFKWLPKSQ